MIGTVLGPLPTAVVSIVGVAASVLTLLCVVPLCVLTWQRKADPSPVTWGIWAAVGIVATIGMALGGAPTPAWLLKGALSLGPVAVAVVALLRSDAATRLDRSDRTCLWLGALGTTAYAFTGEGMVAVGMAMAVDAVGAVPTWQRAWRNPRGELILTYALALASVVAVLVTLPWPWTWLSASYLTFLAVQMTSIIVVLWWSRHRVPAESHDLGRSNV